MTTHIKPPTCTKPLICVVTETFYPEINGVTNTLNQLISGLVRRNYPILVVRPTQSAKNESKTGMPGVLHMTVPGLPLPGYRELKFGLPARSAIIARWKISPPTAVYIATEGPLGWSALSAARKLKIPVLSGFHTNFQSYTRYYGVAWLARLLISYGRWFHNQCNGTLAPTTQIKRQLDQWGFENVSVLGRGVDTTLFSPRKRSLVLRESWGLSPTDLAVIYVGRIAAEKNLQLACKAYRAIQTQHPQTRFILVGDGPLRPTLTKENPDFIFTGVKKGEDLACHYASGDLFLFPSLTETFGNVVAEALASGLAISAFHDAAAAEVLEPMVNGAVSAKGDETAYISTTLRLANRPNLSDIRHRARKTALSLDWNAIVNAFEHKLFQLTNPGASYANRKTSLTFSTSRPGRILTMPESKQNCSAGKL